MLPSQAFGVPALPTFQPRPQGIPVATMAMQKILSKAIRSHGSASTSLKNFAVKGADKMGGKAKGKTSAKSGRPSRTAPAARTAATTGRK